MMRRFIALVLVCMLLCGCTSHQSKVPESVTFYFLYKDYDFEQHESIIATEIRDAADHRTDLTYLLTLYQMGPAEEDHISPLPMGTRISVTENENGLISLTLSEHAQTMTDAQFSLACGCLSMTCFDITESQKITVINGERSLTMTAGSLTLVDDHNPTLSTEETT